MQPIDNGIATRYRGELERRRSSRPRMVNAGRNGTAVRQSEELEHVGGNPNDRVRYACPACVGQHTTSAECRECRIQHLLRIWKGYGYAAIPPEVLALARL